MKNGVLEKLLSYWEGNFSIFGRVGKKECLSQFTFYFHGPKWLSKFSPYQKVIETWHFFQSKVGGSDFLIGGILPWWEGFLCTYLLEWWGCFPRGDENPYSRNMIPSAKVQPFLYHSAGRSNKKDTWKFIHFKDPRINNSSKLFLGDDGGNLFFPGRTVVPTHSILVNGLLETFLGKKWIGCLPFFFTNTILMVTIFVAAMRPCLIIGSCAFQGDRSQQILGLLESALLFFSDLGDGSIPPWWHHLKTCFKYLDLYFLRIVPW